MDATFPPIAVRVPYYWRDQAFRAVDACGGAYSPEEVSSGYAAGHKAALDAACDALTNMGAMDPPARAQVLLEALRECADRFERALTASGTDPEYAALAVESYRAAIKLATGEPS